MVRESSKLRGHLGSLSPPILLLARTQFQQEEMAAASLDVNFKEELSAIEQCKRLLNHSPCALSDVSFIKGSKFCRKRSAQPLCTVFSNIPPRSKFVFSLPFYNKWPGLIL